MILTTYDPELFVINGTWIESSESIAPTAGSNYNFKGGTFQDFTGSVTTRSYAFHPDEQFLDRTPVFSTLQTTDSFKVVTAGDSKGLRRYRLNNSTSGGIVRHKFHSYVNGTFGKTAADRIITKLSTGAPEVGLWNSDAAAWNRNCWGFGYNLTGLVSRSQFAGGYTKERGGCAITSRHILNASHYPIGVGWKVRFVTKGATALEDTVVERTITAQYSGWTEFGEDNIVSLLDSDLPAGITPFEIIDPTNYSETDSGTYQRVPGMTAGKLSDLIVRTATDKLSSGAGSADTNLDQLAVLNGVTQPTYDPGAVEPYLAEWLPLWVDYADFIRPTLRGDSGSPVFIPLSSSEVGLVKVSGGLSAANLNSMIATVDAIGGVSTGYSVTVAPAP